MSQICTKACLDNLNPAGGVSQRSSCQWSCKSSIGEASTAFSPSRLLESDVCLADMLQLLSSGSPSAALSMDIDCMFVSTDHGTGMQGLAVPKSARGHLCCIWVDEPSWQLCKS
ncbi:TPA: hypothetical protein ACH3X2_013406 [Trebouxia sp. C0005]